MNENTMNIYQRMLAIASELETIAKNLEIKSSSQSYKAVGEADVLHAVKPLEEKYGVYSYPVTREIVESAILESKDKYGNERKTFFERIRTVYRFVNIDNPSEYIDQESLGDGIDTADKSVGKAMTYSDKYSLLKAYKAVTGDDPDQYASEDYYPPVAPSPKPKAKPASKAPAAPSPAPAPAPEAQGLPFPDTRPVLDPKILGEATELGLNLDKFAVFMKKTVAELTNDDLRKGTEMKRRANASAAVKGEQNNG